MRTFFALFFLMLLTAPALAMPREEYMRAMTLVNWTELSPQAQYDEETLPKSFEARVRKAGKLQSMGLPVHVGDLVRLDQQGPYIWSVSKGDQSININTYDIPAQAYPRFRE